MRAHAPARELLGVLFELRQTVMAAKKIGLPVVDMACRSGAGLHFHAADWIDHDEFTRCWRVLDVVKLYPGSPDSSS